jgi:hypothetical protein
MLPVQRLQNQVVAGCFLSDVNGPIACTEIVDYCGRTLYGYFPNEDKEVEVFFFIPLLLWSLAADNLPRPPKCQ